MFWGLKSTSPKSFGAWNQLHQKVFGVKINLTRKLSGLKSTLPKSFGNLKSTSPKSFGAWNQSDQKVSGLDINLVSIQEFVNWCQFGGDLTAEFFKAANRQVHWLIFLEFFLYCHFHFQIVHWLIFLENKVFYIITFWLSGSWMNDTFEWWSQLKSSLLCRWALVMNCNCVILWYLVISCDILIFHLKLLCIAGKW